MERSHAKKPNGQWRWIWPRLGLTVGAFGAVAVRKMSIGAPLTKRLATWHNLFLWIWPSTVRFPEVPMAAQGPDCVKTLWT